MRSRDIRELHVSGDLCIFCIVGGRGQDWWKKKPEESVVKKKENKSEWGCVINYHKTYF